ncbi:MAG: Sporulation initiation inhibitor protein Soj [Candidatus Omnitrophica bacterium ADurb.Bin292]|jgi:chromosome partitioning protein|nr:MAG: Sporulation initiation inhibitor protein Soj [Candidatus Omnitrophica bacterium ADurb.Bin292]
MGAIFSFFNQKGGVGKTTSVINIATVLSGREKKVLLIDLDAQGNTTSGIGLDKNNSEFTAYQLLVDNSDPISAIKETSIKNLYAITANSDLAGAEIQLINQEKREFVLKTQLEKVKNDYDFIFLDCPPSLGLISINALTASNYVIIPLQCEYYALEGLVSLLKTYELVKKGLNPDLMIGGVVLTMANFQTNLTKQVIDEVREFFKEKVFNSVIPRSVKLSEAPSFGKPAVIYDTHNRGSQAYMELGVEFLKWFGTEDDRIRLAQEQKMTDGAENPVLEGSIPQSNESGNANPENTDLANVNNHSENVVPGDEKA